MKLPALLVDGFDDCQLNFENLQTVLTTPGAATLPFLELAVTGTNRKVAFGGVTLTWPGSSTNTNQATITHGLGTTPQITLATGVVSSTGNFWWPNVANITSSTFTVQGSTGNTAVEPVNGTTGGCYWLVIG